MRRGNRGCVPVMAAGRRYRSFVHSIVLLLWVCIHYVEASSGKHVIHKKVGDTVVLSSGLPTEGVTAATWRYEQITAADKDEGVSKDSPFKDRSELNPEDFTLTVRKLTLQDSGDFTFVSEVNDKQRPSVTITLQVHDVETSSGKHVIHKKVGDTVELSSGLPTEGVTAATWKYGEIIIADKYIENNMGVSKRSPFKDRSELNQENFTLTVRKLTLQDSGDFIFVSATKEKQRDSVIITLQVHEPITKQPVIKINSTWISSNESCKVLLECNTTGEVSYKWTVGKQTLTGPRQQYIIRQDGETNVTCTVSNHVSEKSAFQTVKCSKDHSLRKETECSSSSLVMFIAGLFTGILITLLLLFLLYCIKRLCHKRLTQSETINQEENQQHVYSALSHGDRCVYETVRGSEDAGPAGSQIQCIKSD